MKKIFALLIVLASLFTASPAFADGGDDVTFCHKEGTPAEQTMTLPRQAFENGHSGHGDTEGACSDDSGGNGSGNGSGDGVDYHPETTGGTTTFIVVTEDGQEKRIVKGTTPVCFSKKSALGVAQFDAIVVTPEGKVYDLDVAHLFVTHASFAIDGCSVYASGKWGSSRYEDIYRITLFDNGGVYAKQITKTPTYAERNVEVVDTNNLYVNYFVGNLQHTRLSLVALFNMSTGESGFVGWGEYAETSFGVTAIGSGDTVTFNGETVAGELTAIAPNGDVFVSSNAGLTSANGLTINVDSVKFSADGDEVILQESGTLQFADLTSINAAAMSWDVLSEVELPDGFNLLDFWTP